MLIDSITMQFDRVLQQFMLAESNDTIYLFLPILTDQFTVVFSLFSQSGTESLDMMPTLSYMYSHTCRQRIHKRL